MEDRTPTPIIVCDFNQYAVRAALVQGRMQKCEKSQVLPNGNKQTIKVEEGVILVGSMFREDVQLALPYIETMTQTRYGYEGVLIDEERILRLEVRLSPFVSPCIDEAMLCRLAKMTRLKSVLLMCMSLGNSVFQDELAFMGKVFCNFSILASSNNCKFLCTDSFCFLQERLCHFLN